MREGLQIEQVQRVEQREEPVAPVVLPAHLLNPIHAVELVAEAKKLTLQPVQTAYLCLILRRFCQQVQLVRETTSVRYHRQQIVAVVAPLPRSFSRSLLEKA